MVRNSRTMTVMLLFSLLPTLSVASDQTAKKPSFVEFIKAHVASREEIDVFLHEMSWAQFDPVVGYILGNYVPRDGIDGSSTISTVQPNGARTSFMYKGKPCRINTYGNSFTQCHQVSDGETWHEYLAAHLGEPIRNFGMGGFGFCFLRLILFGLYADNLAWFNSWEEITELILVLGVGVVLWEFRASLLDRDAHPPLAGAVASS